LQALISALFTKPSEMRLFTGLSALDPEPLNDFSTGASDEVAHEKN
jgi:hypothetical protein